MGTLRAGVIGVGYLGNFHAQKYRHCPGVELYGVVDTNYARAQEVASKYQVGAYAAYRDLFDKVDVVSIVVPPAQHYRIARDFLENGVHSLVEKPVSETVEQAELLIQIASNIELKFIILKDLDKALINAFSKTSCFEINNFLDK